MTTKATHLKSKSRAVTLDELKQVITPPALGPRHCPVPHHVIVEQVRDVITEHGFTCINESLAVGRARNVLVNKKKKRIPDTTLTATFDLVQKNDEGTEGKEEVTSMGLISNNVRERSIRLLAGGKVLVCDNLLLTGDEVMLNKKHTSGLNLGLELEEGFSLFMDKQVKVERGIDLMKKCRVEDEKAERFLYQMFSKKVLPAKFLLPIHKLYYDEEAEEINKYRGTAWGLNNACTRAFRELPMNQKFKHTKAITVPFKELVGK